jgi:hypothetical protein
MKKPLSRRLIMPDRRNAILFFAADPCEVVFACTEKQQVIVVAVNAVQQNATF